MSYPYYILAIVNLYLAQSAKNTLSKEKGSLLISYDRSTNIL